MQKVINFSGGRTSALMTIMEYAPDDIVLFCDTGREHPKTYKFINYFEAFEGIPIHRTKMEGGFEEAIAKNSKSGNFLPNRVARFCTNKLKIEPARDYLKKIGITECNNLIGFRYDEPHRVHRYKSRWVKFHSKFPLYEKRITKEFVNHYWSKKSYNLEIPHILGNCDLCFMKGKNAIISILKSYPELAEKWIADEKRTGSTYMKDISYEQLLKIAQNNLFRDYDLSQIKPAFDCTCTL